MGAGRRGVAARCRDRSAWAAAPAVAAAILGMAPAAIAIPLVGAAFAGVLMGVEAILHSGCGQTCVVTSQWANQAERLLRQNCDTYFAQSPRTTSDQQSALNVFDADWAGLVQRCSQAGLGQPDRTASRIGNRARVSGNRRAHRPGRVALPSASAGTGSAPTGIRFPATPMS